MKQNNCTYIIKCADESLYTGWTNNLEKRIAAHNAGTGAKYTRGRTPVVLVHCESFATKEEAQKRESEIKRMKKPQKLALINAYK